MKSNRNIICQSTGEVAKDYKAYLRTRHWANIRLDLQGTPCLICEFTRTQPHHRTYDNLGCEEPEDIVCLCAKHHMAIHGIRKTKKNKPKKYRPPSKNSIKRQKRRAKKQANREEHRKRTEKLRTRNEALKYVKRTENGQIIKVYATP